MQQNVYRVYKGNETIHQLTEIVTPIHPDPITFIHTPNLNHPKSKHIHVNEPNQFNDMEEIPGTFTPLLGLIKSVNKKADLRKESARRRTTQHDSTGA